MKIRTFKVEQWMNDWETRCRYNLAETCIDSLTVRELLELSGEDVGEYMKNLADTRLTYSHIEGSPELLAGIASLYENVNAPEHISPLSAPIWKERKKSIRRSSVAPKSLSTTSRTASKQEKWKSRLRRALSQKQILRKSEH